MDSESDVTFEQLGLNSELCSIINQLGWTKPTKVQRESIPLALEGKDIVAIAETGSGKTGAYALPILNKLPKDFKNHFALVIAPTRELALQVEEQFNLLGKNSKVKTLLLVGGQDRMTQAIAIAKKPQIIISTPGRLIDLMNNVKGINLKTIEYFVLDEADKILKMDLNNEVEELGKLIPAKRHTYFFSATLTNKLQKFKRLLIKKHEFVQIDYQYKTVDTLKQYYLLVPVEYKEVYLVYLLKKSSFSSFIVFCNKAANAQKIAFLLRNLGFSAIPLYGSMSQNKRFSAIEKFKAKSRSVLVATDIASRGIDIENIDLVINFDVPSPIDYIHRVGRTARAGKDGTAISLITQVDVIEYQKIEESIQKKNELYKIDEKDVMQYANRVEEANKEAIFEIIEMTKRKRDKSGNPKNEDFDDYDDLDDYTHNKKFKKIS